MERLSDTSSKGRQDEISLLKETTTSLGECKFKHPLSDWTENACATSPASTSTVRQMPLGNTQQLPQPQTVSAEEVSINGQLVEPKLDKLAAQHISKSGFQEPEVDDNVPILKDVSNAEAASEEESEDLTTHASGNKETTSLTKDAALDDRLCSLQARSSKMRNEIENRQREASLLKQELTTKTVEFQRLESDRDLLKKAVEMICDDQHSSEFYIEDLNKQVEARKQHLQQHLQQLELQRNASIKTLEEKKGGLEELPHAEIPKRQLDLQKLKDVEQETEAIIVEIQKREEERCKLSAELEKRPKALSRASYIQRVSEITKNSRKQDADIERILKDTRDIQIESNSIQERLHRTYVVADETMFRDVKKDPVREKAYRLLTTIHESFGQIYEKIIATDRIRREIVEQEGKIAAVGTRKNVSMDILQADLDAAVKGNELLGNQDPLLH